MRILLKGREMNSDKSENVWDNVYENFKSHDIINKYIYSKLIKLLNKYISKNDSILEVGSGSGAMVSYFQNQGHFSVGLDYYINPLKIAKRVFNAKNLVRGNMFNLPFKDSSFDIVWNEGVLEHFKIDKSIEAAKEMARVSKKYVIIDVPNRYTLFVIRKFMLKMIGKWSYGYEESYSPKRLRYLMTKAGLNVIGVQGVHLPPPMAEWNKWNLLHLLLLEVPLSKKRISNVLNKFSEIEDNHPRLTRMFGFHLIMVGEVNNSE